MNPLTVATLLFCLAAPLISQEVPRSRSEIEAVVREYILQHPEVLMESVRAHQERQRAARQREASEAIVARRKELTNDAATPQAGKGPGKVPVVVFSDYRCGYCKRAEAAILQLAAEDSGAYLVFKELPILGPESAMAAAAALAAHRQGAYLRFRQELMGATQPLTEEVIDGVAAKLGLDVGKLRQDMRSAETSDAITRNQRLASEVGVQATPSFVIGSELVSGALDATRFQALIAKARTTQQASK